MKTGIIVYSQTGNTLQAAQRLLEAMKSKGQDAELIQIKIGNQKLEMNPKRVQLNYCPAVAGFDHLVFAAPVWAFSMCPVMKTYLDCLPSLSGKKIDCFVTHALPLHWMGGTRALAQMASLCKAKGGEVGGTFPISWTEGHREENINKMIGSIV